MVHSHKHDFQVVPKGPGVRSGFKVKGLGVRARRCRATMAYIRQSRPDSGLVFQVKIDSGLGFQVKVLKTFHVVASSLGSGRGQGSPEVVPRRARI